MKKNYRSELACGKMALVSCLAVGTLWVKFISGSLLPTWRLLGSKMHSKVHIATWTLEAQQVVCPILAAN